MFAKRAFLWLALLAVTTFSIWGISPRLEAQSELDEVLPERLEMLVYPPTEENSAELAAVLAQMAPPDTAATAAPPNFHLPATLLVYQNFDTGNWEVLLNTAAQAKINLSNHPAADIHPRLNRGATHVLFASNRAGNFDLYVMKVDGSNLTQLTASAGDDVNPVWSPDGSKIAFESYRDGQPEIYVMNADGSNQTRLTASPDFDGMPTWSPDGQMIAFSSRRTGGYRIYTMDAATGANQIQRSTHAYSLSPAWAPDGSKILYSAAYTTMPIWLSGYQLQIMGDGSFYAHPTPDIANYSFSRESDVWIRDWAPDSSRVLLDVRYYTQVQSHPQSYQLDKLEIWASHNVLIWDTPQLFNTNDFLSINPDADTLDVIPPIVHMKPQLFMPASAVIVPQWRYVEFGSEVDVTEVQYKTGNEGWQSLYTNLPGEITGVSFNQSVSVGQTVEFRAQSMDKHLNQGIWSTPSSTTFYNWYLTGQLRDNRGQAVASIPVTLSKTTLNEVTTDVNGRYSAQTSEVGSYQISVAGQGQTLLTPTTLDRETRSHLPYAYLSPSANLLANGNFEVDWNQWQNVSGAVEGRTGFTGQSAVSLGEPFNICTNCIKNLHTFGWYDDFYNITYGHLIADKLGNIHLLFLARLDMNSIDRYYHTILNFEGEWSTVQPTSITTSSPFRMSTEDKQGNLHILYIKDPQTSTSTYYARYNPTTGWSSPELVSTEDISGPFTDMFVDNYGEIHVSNRQGRRYLKRTTSGTWVEQPIPVESAHYAIAQLENGEIELFQALMTQYIGGISSGVYVMSQYRYQSNGTWQKVGEFFPRDYLVSYLMDAVFVPYEKMWYVINHRYQAGEGWVSFSPEIMPTAQMTRIYFNGTRIEVQVREPHQYYIENLFSEASGAREWLIAVLDTNQMLHYITEEMKYYGRHGRTALHDQTHTLAQVVTIPADMPNPTVSLMYRTVRDIPGDDTQFEVRLTNGTMTTTHVLSPTAVVWEHAWFDASEWAGETVTLTLAAVQRAGDPLLRVDLDDVSLGSAAPDTWVTVAAPNAAMPSEEVNITLNYGNLSPDLLAHTTTLTLTLPAGLVVNSISITPTVQTAEHIIWQLGDLPAKTSGTITITASVNGNVPLMSTLNATAELRTPLAEPSWGNNEHTAALFIGRRAYLPAIFK